MSKKALGKGLGALLKEAEADTENRIDSIPISHIYPCSTQPRKDFDEKSLKELSASIKSNGIIQPILVSKENEAHYSITVGERRWRAAKLAKLTRVPCIVRSSSEEKRFEIALIENLQRKDLNPLEEAGAYRVLIDKLGFTQEETAESIGKDRSTIANMLRLLKLPPRIQNYIRNDSLSSGHARTLITIEEDSDKLRVCDRIIKRSLSVRQTESFVKKFKEKRPQEKPKDTNIKDIENELVKILDTRVVITGKEKGSVKIFFRSPEELNKITKILKEK